MIQGDIQDLLIENEMKDSYLAYAMSVIVSRALPDVRDGLKPSQRRILVAMNDINLTPGGKFRKCAKIVGDTSGNYHPHGDQVIYPTLVRMAQLFNMGYPLIDGQGNFGSVDGDPPAAMRYTECRLTQPSSILLDDLKFQTVKFISNYDDTRVEPTVLPGPFPNLLANGSSGIAVGMATSIPPHNLREVCQAIIALIDNPELTIVELMQYIQGPDFPTGGIICGRTGILAAYQTGRSTITVRARVEFEEKKNGHTDLVITEIPYQVSKNKIIEKIVEQVKAGRLKGISDLRDESDRDGMRLVIIPKRGEDPEVVLNLLYKHTQLQSTFSIIMIALRDKRPHTFNLKEFIESYILHRFIVITKKTEFLLKQALKKAHDLEGLLIAFDFIDEIITLIRASDNVDTARAKLIQLFEEEKNIKTFLEHRLAALQEQARDILDQSSSGGMLSPVQADMILKMRLQSLTGLERQKLEKDYADLTVEIEGYRVILGDDQKIYQIIKDQMVEIEKKFSQGRRTEIQAEEVGNISIEDLIPVDDFAITISEGGYIKRVALSTYKQQHRGGKGIKGADTKTGDTLDQVFIANSHDYILFFTDRGKMYARKVYEIPELSRISAGRSIVNLLALEKEETVTSLLTIHGFDEDKHVFMVTKKGVVKKTSLKLFANVHRRGIIAIKLMDDDLLIETRLTSGEDQIVLGTRMGKAIMFHEQDVRSLSRSTRGVRGIRLKGDDTVCGMVLNQENHSLLTVCENGFGKRTPFEEYRNIRRGGQGVINIKASARNGKVIAIHTVSDEDQLMLISSKGKIIRLSIDNIRLCGRATQGVRLIRMGDEDKLVSSAKIRADQIKEELEEDPGQKNQDVQAPETPVTEEQGQEEEKEESQNQEDNQNKE